MKKKFSLMFVLAFVGVMLFSFNTEAATAVTISVDAGPAFVMDGAAEINLIVPERLAESLPLNVGDKVFFHAVDKNYPGEGTIADIYETEDETITKAFVIDHVSH